LHYYVKGAESRTGDHISVSSPKEAIECK